MTVFCGRADHFCLRIHYFFLFFCNQVLKGSPVSGILMTALTTSVRMEEFVWMGLILTTAAAPLSGQVCTLWWLSQKGMWVGDQRQAASEVSIFYKALCATSLGIVLTPYVLLLCSFKEKSFYRYLLGSCSELSTMLRCSGRYEGRAWLTDSEVWEKQPIAWNIADI